MGGQGGCRVGQPVQERRSLVRQVADEPPRERRQLGQPRAGQCGGDPLQRSEHIEAARFGGHRQLPADVVPPDALVVRHDGGCGCPRDERVPAPSFGALHALQQHAGPVARHAQERAERRGEIREELRPYRNHGPGGRESLERLAVRRSPESGYGPHRRCRSRVGDDPEAAHDEAPGLARGRWVPGAGSDRSTARSAAPGASSPTATTAHWYEPS